ncbi:MAG: tyrosine-type recombinase/integrase [Acidobacteria bacterium]|nr:tyrosine-type recombinase/integrase [Acidobacteriota bacterium]
MPLTQRQVDAIRPTGKPFKLYDRDGLMVRVTVAGKARWVWRGVVKGRRIEVGMGSTRFRSLKEAREVAFEHTRTARLGGDPRAPVVSDVPTFSEAATLYLEIQSTDWGEVHSRQVRRLLERHAFPSLGDLPVNEIQTADLMRVLVPLWRRQRPTGQRVRQRIAGVMAWSVAAGYRSDDPTSTLSAVLPAGRKPRKHHRYLPAEELPEALAKVEGSGARIGTQLAMRFLALTAARSGEVRGARWREVDLESATWTVPASRMKSRKEHRVPLSSAALVVLERADGLRGRGRGLVFPGVQGKMIGVSVFGRLLRDLEIDCSPHGFRSSFRSWCSDEGIDREVAEQALAHAVGSQVEQCYARSDVLERRREVMEAWGTFLVG